MCGKRGSILATFFAAWFVSGCGFYDSVPVGTIFVDETIAVPIPYMNGDVDRIARVRCKLEPLSAGAVFRGACEIAFSNGVSDLANDLHTGIEILDAFEEADLEDWLVTAGGFACGYYIAEEGLPALRYAAAVLGKQNGWPGLGTAVSDYLTRHSVASRASNWCADAVDLMWDETDDNTYSGGHRCAVGRVTITARDLERPPEVAFATFARDEASSLCPRARIVYDVPWSPVNLHWGND
jgi:hypothetical protein